MTNASPANDPSVTSEGEDASAIAGRLFSIARSTRAFLALLLAQIGLHPGQDQLLERLELDRPVSVSVLAEQLSVRPSTVSKMLDRLIEKGLVRRAGSTSDGRRTMVLLTEEGEGMRERIKAVWQRLEEEIAMAVDPKERESVAAALRQVDAALTTRLKRLR